MRLESELTAGKGSSVKAWARFGGFICMILTFTPVMLVMRACRIKAGDAIPCLFHNTLNKLIGVRVRVRGEMAGGRVGDEPTFFVANHSSYLDIPVLGAVIHGCFVAKSEVSGWPLIGQLARLQNTIFIERRAIRANKQTVILRDNLEKGNSLILFPEGTSSDGMRTLPFKSSLFSIVEKELDSGRHVPVQPVTVLCTEIGGMPMGRAWRPYYSWFGDMTLVKHVWDVFKIGSFTVDIIFHPPVTMEDFGSRKMLSTYCQKVISDGVDQCVTGRFEKKLAS